MKRVYKLIAFVPVIGFAVACGGGGNSLGPMGPIEVLPRELTSAELALVEADNSFAMHLFRAVEAQANADENLFISPLSVSMALGMTYNGAAGATRDSMAQTLGFEGLAIDQVNEGYRGLIDLLVNLDRRVTFDLANSIWYRPEFAVLPKFLDAATTFFDARVEALDFSAPNAPDIINRWVRDHTNERIDSIAPKSIDPSTVMFIINAVFFKGDWTNQFDKSLTSDRPFTLRDGSEKSVPTMSHADPVPVRVTGDQLANVIEMSYGGGAFTMVAAVPAAGVTLDEVIAAFDRDRWQAWTAGLEVDSANQIVVMPKFQFEYKITMNDVLSALGMGIAFDAARADFSNITPGTGLFINQVLHKTFVKVDEVGTEAAAVTSVSFGITSEPPPFVIDQPFLFVLRERISGTILFIGKVVDPTG